MSILMFSLYGWTQTGAVLETPFFYFDNPDGTIEEFPEYTFPGLDDRMMSISSSKYANDLKGDIPENLRDIVMLMLGRQTRTTVFVFDGEASSQALMMTTSIYGASLMGLWAALWDEMAERISKQVPGSKKEDYHKYVITGNPEELMFNGCEGGRIVNKVDLSNSILSLLAGESIVMVFEEYFYYEPKLEKVVGVIFSYSEVGKSTSTTTKGEALSKALSFILGNVDPATGKTALAKMFEHRDMKDFFLNHFHLKTDTPNVTATFTGTAKQPRVKIGDKEVDTNIEIILKQQGGKTEDDENGNSEETKQTGGQKKIGKVGPGNKGPGNRGKDNNEGGGTGGEETGSEDIGGEGLTGSAGGGRRDDDGAPGDIVPPVIDPIPEPTPPIPDPTPPTPVPVPEPITNPIVPPEIKEQIKVWTAKYAIVSIDPTPEGPLAENDRYIYLVQPSWKSNAVLAIDKLTGAVTEVVPSKQKTNHPDVLDVAGFGNDLYLAVSGKGIVRYDGKSIESSTLIAEIDNLAGFMGKNYKYMVLSPNGRYLAYGGDYFRVYDLQDNNKLVKTGFNGDLNCLVTNDGDYFGFSAYRVVAYRNDGTVEASDPTTMVEVSELLGERPTQLWQQGNDVYILGGNKVMKTPSKEFNWTKVHELPADIKLNHSALTTDGQGFAYISPVGDNRFISFNIGGSAPIRMKELKTALRSKYGSVVEVSNTNYIYADAFGNFWVCDQQFSCFVVFNPKGIHGLNALAGKTVKY